MLVTYKQKKNKATSGNTPNQTQREFIEVARGQPPKAKNKKNKKRKGMNLNRMDSMSRDFACALKLPFHPYSVGCRVPDIYSAPTATFHVRGNVVFSSTAAGTLASAFFPCPVLSMIDVALDSNNTACYTSGMSPVGLSGNCVYGATTTTGLSNVLSSYRVASWGIKITNLQPMLSAAGRVYIALIPSISVVPDVGVIQTNNFTNGSGFVTNAFTNVSNAYTPSILDFPQASLITMSELVTGSVCVSPSPVNPVFYTFKPTLVVPRINSLVNVNDQVPFGGLTPQVGININNISGGMTVLIYGDGFPASLSNALDVEFIYHLEGTPALSVSSTPNLATAAPMQHVGGTEVVEKAIRAAPASSAISFLTEVEQLGALAAKGYNAAKDFSQTPLGGAMASAVMALF